MLGLLIAVGLIIFRVAPAYAMIFGALLGGLIGGADMERTIQLMTGGAKDIIPATLRILTAGVLAGVLIESGAAHRISQTIIRRFGASQALLALAVSAMVLTAVGVFIDVAVITVSPIALAICRDVGYSVPAALLAMIGGGKAGNVISPNPNTIAAAQEFDVELPSLMFANLIPALVGLVATVLIARFLMRGGRPQIIENRKTDQDNAQHQLDESSSPFWAAVSGPIVTILLLVLQPVLKLLGVNMIRIDPLIALPIGGIVGCLCMGHARRLGGYMSQGLQRMGGVAILLLGTGTIAGIIKGSALQTDLVDVLNYLGLPDFLLAPISGIVMSAVTASTTAGTTVASSTFHDPLLAMGLAPIAAAAMIHAGATVLDHLPHGSFFHTTGGAVGMSIRERFFIIPYETAVGLVLVTVSTLIHM